MPYSVSDCYNDTIRAVTLGSKKCVCVCVCVLKREREREGGTLTVEGLKRCTHTA